MTAAAVPRWHKAFDSDSPVLYNPRSLSSYGSRAIESEREAQERNSRQRLSRAKVAELVDALDSGSSVRKDVGVRVPPFAPLLNC